VADARRLLILADDFTGACDAAAPFATSRATLVVHGVPSQWPSDAEVLSVDLDLREGSNVDAEKVARESARHLCAAHPEADVLLKIDSTLRGPIAGMVAGALAGSGKAVAVLAPAFPEQGRLFRDGRVYVNGVAGASLKEALGIQHTAVLGAQHVVVDAESPTNLQTLARAWPRHPEWLLVGSGGLARQIAGGAPHRPNEKILRTGGGPILVVAGSPTPQTQAQLERLRGLATIVVAGGETRVPKGQVIVLCTPPAAARDAGEAARALADITQGLAAEFTPGALVLTGGATARFVCERLGAHGVRLEGELQPGVPYGTLHGGLWHGVQVVTKAGGFGTPDTLLDVVRALGVSSVAEHTHD
jgi:uncharacterized protein YgbK (DUF1537 family)